MFMTPCMIKIMNHYLGKYRFRIQIFFIAYPEFWAVHDAMYMNHYLGKYTFGTPIFFNAYTEFWAVHDAMYD